MTQASTTQLETGKIAALHRAGDVRGVIGRLVGGKLQIVDSRQFQHHDTRISAWLTQNGVEKAICILPGGSFICRTCQLPNASNEQLLPALRLQAEAHLLGVTPPHRSAMAVLHSAPGETSRSGIILAWPESAAPELPSNKDDQELTFVPDVAALAALLNGERRASRWCGSTAPRLGRDGDRACQRRRLPRHAQDSLFGPVDRRRQPRRRGNRASVGHTGPFVDSLVESIHDRVAAIGPAEGTLLVPPELVAQFACASIPVRAMPSGGPTTACRWALLATMDQLAPLTQLRLDAPVVKPSRSKQILERLSKPGNAAIAVVVCLLLLAVGPLLFSGLRLAILKLKYPDATTYRKSVASLDHQLTMYNDLGQHAWSMSKLLSDIACNTPEGVEFESLSLSQGRGVAPRASPRPSSTATSTSARSTSST